ncbi:DUF5686 and carboxypeptidase-like regulatory domain-containing protein [Dinghuibacter silviterrae]|uniref:Carboxypeptidase-like protein n=1 Tax=Dinghuibacter silviterrae TaxID=1539049 RepID=A0A4R8DGM5_9BACT|nr:DUF5686 and carboxypeptidase-like regulatory domain-containing protein [Dinghuibacter silviterrae]TDW96394.1 carboxypeptidase-like protein [Dinghuibacter silviterrae]
MPRPLFILLIFVCCVRPAIGQVRIITGTVVDSASGSPLPNVSVTVKGARAGRITDAQGHFSIEVTGSARRLVFTATGYKALMVTVSDTTPIKVALTVAYTSMAEVVVKSKRHYRNKHNPAVELIREVIAHKSRNAPSSYPFLTFDQYEKLRLLSDQPPRFLREGSVLRKYSFILDNPDTTLVPGKHLIPLYMEETASRNYYRLSPLRRKQVILGHNRVNLGEYVDAGGIGAIIAWMYNDFSVYDNTMTIFTIQFMGPLADLAPQFYMYFIRDTSVENGTKVVHVSFMPRDPEDLLFRGELYIALDSSYAVRRADLQTGSHANLNWVRSFNAHQEFEKGPSERYYRSLARETAFLSPFPKSRGFFGERTMIVRQVNDSTLPDSVFHGLPVDTTLASVPLPDTFARPVPLTQSEAETFTRIDSLARMRSYRRTMDILTLLSVGYKTLGPIDLGRVGNFYSFNQLEGQRFQVGGRTNTHFSTRYFGDGYIAYGTKDRQWKYNLTATYSINHKSIYTYPFHFIQVNYQHDVKNPGQETEFTQNNSFLSSFSRGIGGKWLYSDVASVSYIREFGDHFSSTLQAKYWQQSPAQSLVYLYGTDTVRHLTTTQLSFTLGWAPHQQFYQGKLTRRTITNKYPVLSLQYSRGIKGLAGGEYNYDAFHLNVFKRWYVAPLGFTDITLDAGLITGNLPFPLLVIHPANTAYFYSFSAYNLMNVAEFVSDHYAGLNLEHYFNGFFFNRIPLLKRLRLREVVAGKILFGGVRSENDPLQNPEQMKFPALNGTNTIYTLGSSPYIEASVGIYNIFNILRLDYVQRFTYLGHPGISTSGIRFSTSLDF